METTRAEPEILQLPVLNELHLLLYGKLSEQLSEIINPR